MTSLFGPSKARGTQPVRAEGGQREVVRPDRSTTKVFIACTDFRRSVIPMIELAEGRKGNQTKDSMVAGLRSSG